MTTQQNTIQKMFQFVVSFMHWNGEKANVLSPAQYLAVYLSADGFGSIDAGFAKEQSFDWSHVRDSSDAGVQAMVAKLASFGYELK